MKLHVLAVGERVPRWVSDACSDYQQRFPPHCPLTVTAVSTARRGKNPDTRKLKDSEFVSLSKRIPGNALTVALDESGRPWTTEELAERLAGWLQAGTDVVFLIGGPDGLSADALGSVRETWSLSPLTLPHSLARVVVVEQLYRALSILQDHPYHRRR